MGPPRTAATGVPPAPSRLRLLRRVNEVGAARVPSAAARAVVRPALLDRLCAAADASVVTIVAPAGYGKTTLLAQWAECDERPLLHVDLEPEDDDAGIVEWQLAPILAEPGLLALVDNLQVLRSQAAVAMLERLLGRAAPGTTVALAGRRLPPLPLARIRAQGRLVEIGRDELALTGHDAETLLRRAGVPLARQDAAALVERLDGWPAALSLAALSLRSGTPAAAVGGDDRFVAEYLEAEHLVALTAAQRRFATLTSVLDELTPAGCDSLLGRSDSGRTLASLECAGVVVAVDHRRGRYRYPRVVRDLLCSELGLHHEEVAEAHPDLCIAASWLYALRGRTVDAQRWADAAARVLGHGDPRLHVLDGLCCRAGAERMLDDATAACGALPAGHAWRPAAVLARGAALLLCGDGERAAYDLVEATELAGAAGATELRIVGLCVRASPALAGNAQDDAEAFAAEAASLAADESPAPSLAALVLEAAGARVAVRRGDLAAAAAGTERAERLLPFATHAVPWLSVLALLDLAHVRLALEEPDAARALLRRAADVFRVRPRLGVLVEQSAELARRTDALADSDGRWASCLTPAERRLLPQLASHLSLGEIGERLHVSRNTVKTQAIAVYRKLGVTGRSAAVARAVALGLLDAQFTRSG